MSFSWMKKLRKPNKRTSIDRQENVIKNNSFIQIMQEREKREHEEKNVIYHYRSLADWYWYSCCDKWIVLLIILRKKRTRMDVYGKK